MSAISKFDFQKREHITFFWSKFSKLHKKHPILHVATTFSLKQGETRTSHGSIPHPLSVKIKNKKKNRKRKLKQTQKARTKWKKKKKREKKTALTI